MDRHTPARRAEARLRAAPAPAPEFRGRQKLSLIRDLAIGEWNTPSLARMYGTTEQHIEAFQAEHDAEITEVAAALAGHLSIDTAGMWISRRNSRLAEYQQAIEDIDKAIQSLRDHGTYWSRAHRDLFRARLDIYRQAADELGAYPQRTPAPRNQGTQVRYVIETAEDELEDLT